MNRDDGLRSPTLETGVTSQEERIARIIEAYDAQGWHRTATDVDLRSARWLAQQVRECGLEPTLEPFAVSRIDPQSCYLEVDGERVVGLPLFDGTFTHPEGIRGSLGPLGSNAAVALAAVGAGGQVQEFEKARRDGRHQAIVAVTLGGRPGLAARNAPAFKEPFGPPVLQVGSDVRDWLTERAVRGSDCNLVVAASRTGAEAFNVVATLRGSVPSLAPLVITTPRSGWWHCAGERGGGIACWLECIRLLSQSQHERDILFAAFSGHELGFMGVDAFTAGRPGLERRASVWLHFGASIGAAQDARLRFSAHDEALEQLVREALGAEGVTDVPATPLGTAVGGESVVVHERGGRVVAMAGGHALFHLEADRWPEAVDLDLVGRFARAFSGLAHRLAGAPG